MTAEKSSKQTEFTFNLRYQPLPHTPDGILFSFIKNHAVYLPKEMVLQALRERWLALAYLERYERGEITEVELRRIGEDAVYALEQHAEHIRHRLGLNRPVKVQSHVDGVSSSSLGNGNGFSGSEIAPNILHQKWENHDDEIE